MSRASLSKADEEAVLAAFDELDELIEAVHAQQTQTTTSVGFSAERIDDPQSRWRKIIRMDKDTPRRLRHANGYIELGMLLDAATELDRVHVNDRLSPPVLAVRLDLAMAAKHWDTAAAIGRELSRMTPENEQAWISRAFALRELNRVAEARDVLLEAEPLHGAKCALLHYNLACYFCLLGDLETARERLKRAFEMEPKLKKDARDDADLAALRTSGSS